MASAAFVDTPFAYDSASPSEPRTPESASSASEQSNASPIENYIGDAKRSKLTDRRPWTHSLEKALFNPFELSMLGVSQRRPIYIASLEAYIDRLHAQLEGLGPEFYPIALNEFGRLKGSGVRTSKGQLASLHHEIIQAHKHLLELQRMNEGLVKTSHAEK
ncbi:Zinc/cadmium resistance protein [Favolaschia claudopus]|uniref:Zinc/cadmium resistance protein n=1 Tax=Favolaschia claudopus TaxID=2862362 RepID=A0AAW0EHX3_9AGAR